METELSQSGSSNGQRNGLDPSRNATEKSRRWSVASIVVLLAAAFTAGWFAASSRSEHEAKEKLPENALSSVRDSSAVTVTVEPVTHRPVQRTVEALGTLYGFEEVTISARIEGRVNEIRHDVSDFVKPDELLLVIDPTDYELAVQQNDRAVQVELAKLGLKEPPDSKPDLTKVPSVVKARSLLDHAKSRLERINRLVASKNVSAEESETAASDYRTSQAEFDNQIVQAESGLATIQMKQVDLQVAREKLANTKIRAPIPKNPVPGSSDVKYVIAQRMVSEGTLVRPGTDLYRIVMSQMLKLRVPVAERFSSQVELSQSVDVYTAVATTPFAGTVTRIYPTVDVGTRTFQVEIQVPNPTGELKPGSFAKAAIRTRIDPNAATVPLSAVVQFAGITKLFIIKENVAKELPVTLGTQTTEWVEISSPPLPDGTIVVTSGQTSLANDTPVTIRAALTKLDEKSARPTTVLPSAQTGQLESTQPGVRE